MIVGYLRFDCVSKSRLLVCENSAFRTDNDFCWCGSVRDYSLLWLFLLYLRIFFSIFYLPSAWIIWDLPNEDCPEFSPARRCASVLVLFPVTILCPILFSPALERDCMNEKFNNKWKGSKMYRTKPEYLQRHVVCISLPGQIPNLIGLSVCVCPNTRNSDLSYNFWMAVRLTWYVCKPETNDEENMEQSTPFPIVPRYTKCNKWAMYANVK